MGRPTTCAPTWTKAAPGHAARAGAHARSGSIRKLTLFSCYIETPSPSLDVRRDVEDAESSIRDWIQSQGRRPSPLRRSADMTGAPDGSCPRSGLWAGNGVLLRLLGPRLRTTQPYRRAYLRLMGPDRQWIINPAHRLLSGCREAVGVGCGGRAQGWNALPVRSPRPRTLRSTTASAQRTKGHTDGERSSAARTGSHGGRL
jgi:hypothetical protein